MNNAIIKNKFRGLMIYILFVIIQSNSFDDLNKLILDKTKKTRKNLINLGFTFHKICPCYSDIIVNKGPKPFRTRYRFHSWSLHINVFNQKEKNFYYY